MLHSPSRRLIASMTGVVLLLPGCGTTENAATDTTLAATTTVEATTTVTSATTTTDAAGEGETVVWFDGSTCEIVGDRTLEAGFHELVFVAPEGKQGDFDLTNLPDGYTFEDALAVWDETHRTADFVIDVIHTHSADGEKRVTFNLSPGTWHAMCTSYLPTERRYAEETILVE